MLVSVGMVAIFAVCCLSTNMVLIPEMDQGTVSISVSMPIGSEVEETSAITDRITGIVERDVPELESMYAMSQAESATIGLNLVGKSERSRSSSDIANDLRVAMQDIAGCEITASASQMTGMTSGDDISVEITGDDYDTLAMVAGDLTNQISALPDAVDVTNSLSEQVPQVKVTMRREAAAQYGLTAAAVGAAVRAELTGATATTVTIDNQELDVIVRGDGAASESLDALRSMAIASSRGGYVPLSAVAEVSVEQAPQSINRSNQSRVVTITGDTISGNTTEITKQITAILDGYTMPEGYTAQITGSYSDMMESFGDLLLALLVALGGAAVAFGVAKKDLPAPGGGARGTLPHRCGGCGPDADRYPAEAGHPARTERGVARPAAVCRHDPHGKGGTLHRGSGGSKPRQGKAGAPVCQLLSAGRRKRFATVRKACKAGCAGRERRRHPRRGGAQRRLHCHGV